MSIQRFTSTDGTSIACFRSGAGSPLLLVHGMSADHSRWAPVLPAFEERFTVYACDRRGTGASADAPEYRIEDDFDDIAAIVDGIGGPVDVVAHSYGAICALEAAARAKNLRCIVLYEPPMPTGEVLYRDGILDRLQALLDAGDRDAVVTTYLREIPRLPDAQLALLRASPSWAARVASAHLIVRELRAHERYTFDPARVRDVRAPMLLLLGGASSAFFRAGIDLVKGAVPSARVVVLPEQQHVAIDAAPKLFSSEVLTFLA